jgi:hypothetical protein
MTAAEDDAAWRDLAEMEANAAVTVLEGKGRKVLVVVLAVRGDQCELLRGASRGTSRADALGFIQGLERERDRLCGAITPKGGGR